MQNPKASLDRLYGGYLHNMTHSPDQLMLVSLRSTNTEALERGQGQAKAITLATSSRHPEDVACNMILRLNLEQSTATSSCLKQQTEIQKLAADLPPKNGTVVKQEDFEKASAAQLENYTALQRQISAFLVYGEGYWWHKEEGMIVFHDGTHDPESLPQGPSLMHFRSNMLHDVQQHRAKCWEKILKTGVTLPLPVSTGSTEISTTAPVTYDYGGCNEAEADIDEGVISTPRPAGSKPAEELIEVQQSCGPFQAVTGLMDLSLMASRLPIALTNESKDEVTRFDLLQKHQAEENFQNADKLNSLLHTLHRKVANRCKALQCQIKEQDTCGKQLLEEDMKALRACRAILQLLN